MVRARWLFQTTTSRNGAQPLGTHQLSLCGASLVLKWLRLKGDDSRAVVDFPRAAPEPPTTTDEPPDPSTTEPPSSLSDGATRWWREVNAESEAAYLRRLGLLLVGETSDATDPAQPPDAGTRYARDVVNHRVPACQAIRRACRRHLHDLGHALKTGSCCGVRGGVRSAIGGPGGVVEVIQPGFFRDVLEGDTAALWNHRTDFVLRRTTASPPSLSLRESESALEVEIRPADNARNRGWIVTPIERGEIRHMSFAFRTGPDGDSWTELPDGRLLRTLLPRGCVDLSDVSPVTRQAYVMY